MAADQGDPIGQNNIGHMYADGQGVEKDDESALYWLTISFLNGHEASRSAIDKARKSLSPSEIERVHNLVRSATGGKQELAGNVDLWLLHASELGLSTQAQKGLMFLCAACGSLGNDREFIHQWLNWFFPIDPLRDLDSWYGEININDGKISRLIEELLYRFKADIEFRDITLGEVSIKALNPKSHGLLSDVDIDIPTMFSATDLYLDFLQQIGSVFEERYCSFEDAFFVGLFYLQINVQTDVKGFINTFQFLRESTPPIYRYLVDMPGVGDRERLKTFIPFQRILYVFLRGMSGQTAEPLWNLQSYVFYKSDPDGEIAIQYLSPEELARKINADFDSFLGKYPGVLESINTDEILSKGTPIRTDESDLFQHVEKIVHQEWGGTLSDFSKVSIGEKLTLNVCVFCAVTAIRLTELSLG